MTTILLTGAAGFIGSHLTRYILEHTDWTVVGLDRLDPETTELGPYLFTTLRNLFLKSVSRRADGTLRPSLTSTSSVRQKGR